MTGGSKNEAKRLAAIGLRFGEAIKRFENYWDVFPGSVCLRCFGMALIAKIAMETS